MSLISKYWIAGLLEFLAKFMFGCKMKNYKNHDEISCQLLCDKMKHCTNNGKMEICYTTLDQMEKVDVFFLVIICAHNSRLNVNYQDENLVTSMTPRLVSRSKKKFLVTFYDPNTSKNQRKYYKGGVLFTTSFIHL